MGIEPVVILLQVVRLAVPYTLTSVGATFSERGGVVNLALEGMILVGAFGAAFGQYQTGSAIIGVFLALLCGLCATCRQTFVGFSGLTTSKKLFPNWKKLKSLQRSAHSQSLKNRD